MRHNQIVIIIDRYYDCDRIHGYGGIDHFCIKSFNVTVKNELNHEDVAFVGVCNEQTSFS